MSAPSKYVVAPVQQRIDSARRTSNRHYFNNLFRRALSQRAARFIRVAFEPWQIGGRDTHRKKIIGKRAVLFHDAFHPIKQQRSRSNKPSANGCQRQFSFAFRKEHTPYFPLKLGNMLHKRRTRYERLLSRCCVVQRFRENEKFLDMTRIHLPRLSRKRRLQRIARIYASITLIAI